MDPIAKYRQQVESILHEYAKIPYAHGNIDIQTIFDHEHDHYLLMLNGTSFRTNVMVFTE